MTKIKTSIALDEELLKWVDLQIGKKRFANRTHAIAYALQQLIDGEKYARASKYQLILHEDEEKKYSKDK